MFSQYLLVKSLRLTQQIQNATQQFCRVDERDREAARHRTIRETDPQAGRPENAGRPGPIKSPNLTRPKDSSPSSKPLRRRIRPPGGSVPGPYPIKQRCSFISGGGERERGSVYGFSDMLFRNWISSFRFNLPSVAAPGYSCAIIQPLVRGGGVGGVGDRLQNFPLICAVTSQLCVASR